MRAIVWRFATLTMRRFLAWKWGSKARDEQLQQWLCMQVSVRASKRTHATKSPPPYHHLRDVIDRS